MSHNTDDIVAMFQLDRFGRVTSETLSDNYELIREGSTICIVQNGAIHEEEKVQQEPIQEEWVAKKYGRPAGTRPGRGAKGNIPISMKLRKNFLRAMVEAGIRNPSDAKREVGLSGSPIQGVVNFTRGGLTKTLRRDTHLKFVQFIVKHLPHLKDDREYQRYLP